MVIRTIALLLSLAVLLFSPRAPSDRQSATQIAGLSSASSMPLDGLGLGKIVSGKKNQKRNKKGENEKVQCADSDDCCSSPVYKTLTLGKLTPLETGKHYLVRHVRLLRCPSTLGCCQSFLEQCIPTAVENVSISIPVEEPVGHHQYAYVNETFTFEQHLQCGCRNRTHQALANFISRELLTQYDADDAFDMVIRICRAVKRRIKKLRRFDSRYRLQRKRNRRRRSLC
uniref:Platelet-derived growth factor (PDGF) family profile domain-containing protein n=1 Tax=Strigamia maritima TaxID=126957 RepID=T1INP2_STRMM